MGMSTKWYVITHKGGGHLKALEVTKTSDTNLSPHASLG